jgi:RNA polymerase sigma-70 factor (sigma-E family)
MAARRKGSTVREKDRQDFEQFALARTPELLRAAWLLTGDRYAAEDLVQDTLARLYGKWTRVRRADNPVAYARTVLTRLFIDSRRRRRSGEQPMEHLPEAGRSDPDTALRRTLVDALATLNDTDRAVLVLRFLLDLDVATVADHLDLTGQAVRSRTNRALARVRHELPEGSLR